MLASINQLILDRFGFNLILQIMEKWTIQRLIYTVESYIRIENYSLNSVQPFMRYF